MTLCLAREAAAAEGPKLLTLSGVVVKAEKEALHIRPAGDAKTTKARLFKLTGTSKLSLLAPQMRNNNLVLTQRDTSYGALSAEQHVAVIDANVEGEAIVLSAVVQSAE